MEAEKDGFLKETSGGVWSLKVSFLSWDLVEEIQIG